MNIPLVDLKAQYLSIKNEIDIAIKRVIDDSAFIRGKYVEEFEANFAKALGANFCLGVGNGTDALFIALKALGIGRGDEVITAANTFIATSESISMTGAKVVFIDINAKTYNIDVEKIEENITSRTKAIVPVHLYGHPADMETVLSIAKKYNLFVVEDAAQAHLAEYKGERVGAVGNIGCFSFYPGKNLGAYGDAGALVTNDKNLADKCRMISNHGRMSKFDHEFEGLNSRMDGIQGAILNVKLKHLAEWTEKRRQTASLYNELLENKDIITPRESEDVRHVYHLYVIRVKKDRKKVQEYLKSKGIFTGIHYPIALPNLSAYKYLGYKSTDFPTASKFQDEILSLPLFPELKEEQVKYICDSLNHFK